MVALTGWSIRSTRTGIETFVLGFGWLLGGTVGVGTVVYELSIGTIIHVALPIPTDGASPIDRRGWC